MIQRGSFYFNKMNHQERIKNNTNSFSLGIKVVFLYFMNIFTHHHKNSSVSVMLGDFIIGLFDVEFVGTGLNKIEGH